MKSAGHANKNRNSGIEMKSVVHENSQMNYKAETNFTRGTSRSETINCPSSSFEHGSFKNPIQSYSNCYSSEDDFERAERKEKERYERRLIREHLRQNV